MRVPRAACPHALGVPTQPHPPTAQCLAPVSGPRLLPYTIAGSLEALLQEAVRVEALAQRLDTAVAIAAVTASAPSDPDGSVLSNLTELNRRRAAALRVEGARLRARAAAAVQEALQMV